MEKGIHKSRCCETTGQKFEKLYQECLEKSVIYAFNRQEMKEGVYRKQHFVWKLLLLVPSLGSVLELFESVFSRSCLDNSKASCETISTS